MSVSSMTLRSGRRKTLISRSEHRSFQANYSSDSVSKENIDHNLLQKGNTLQLTKRGHSSDALQHFNGSLSSSNGLEYHQQNILPDNESTILSATESGLYTKEVGNEIFVAASSSTPLSYVNEDYNNCFGSSLTSCQKSYQDAMARTMYDKHANLFNGDVIYSDGSSVIQGSSFSVYNNRSTFDLDSDVQQSAQSDQNLVLENSCSRQSFSGNNKTRVLYRNQLPWDVSNKTYSDDDNEEEYDNSVFEHSQSNQTFAIGDEYSIRKWLYFGLSKPTHWDVENLSKLNAFGKKKVIFLLLLPLMLYLLIGAVRRRNTEVLHDVVSSLDHPSLISPSYDYSSLLDFIKNLNYLFVSLEKPVDEHPLLEDKLVSKSVQKSSVNQLEIKSLVHQLVSEEFNAFQILQKQQETKAWVNHEISQVQSDFTALQSDFKVFIDDFKSSKITTDKISETPVGIEASAVDVKLEELNNKLHFMELKFHTVDAFLNDIKNCCRNDSKLSSVFQHHMVDLLASLGQDDVVPELRPFRNWLFLNFVNSERFAGELKASIDSIKKHQEMIKVSIMEAVQQKIDSMAPSYFESHENNILSEKSTSKIELLIKRAILMYDADKTGQTDYALESGGGSIISTRCSETYNDRNPRITILGFPLWYGSNSPRNAIQPGIHPGQCWAFKGTQGYLVIQLAAIIRPTGFVIEHIPKSISPSGSIASAPKDFSVYGLESEKESEGKLLGTYFYDKDGDPLQYFPVQAENAVHYNFIELKIHSNHGDLNYTCLYRFRVHGFL